MRLRQGLPIVLTVIATFFVVACAPPPLTRPAAASPTAPRVNAPLWRAPLVIKKRAGDTVTLTVEIADTPLSQEIGLSGRAQLPADAGMLFVFPTAKLVAFWMHDTLIPLSIAFVVEGGRIVDIQDMQPRSDDRHSASKPIRYAIEANQGYFIRQGIGPGDQVDVLALAR